MTHRTDVARGRDVVARWCALAEQRLEHLTELFETGRWRRYHTEVAFLENIQEAKLAVETWRNLLAREASPDHSTIDMSWLSRIGTPPRTARPRDQPELRPLLVQIAVEAAAPDVSMSAEPELVVADEAPSAPAMDTPVLDDGHELTLDAIAQRYPLLRNAL
jgi:uncharacterized repeat protein (TIGR03809 family)